MGNQHLYFTTSGSQAGANVEVCGDPADFNNGVGQVGVRVLSWREVRQWTRRYVAPDAA